VLAHIKVQPGADLLESLLAEVGPEDEDTWAYIAQSEIEAARRADQRHGSRTSPKMSGASDSADDEIYACVRVAVVWSHPLTCRRHRMSFHGVKAAALAGLLEMEAKGLLSRKDSFQGMVDAIAYDIRSKSAQRVKRRTEMERMATTITSLDAKAQYLDEQVRSLLPLWMTVASTIAQLKMLHDYADNTKSTMHKKTCAAADGDYLVGRADAVCRKKRMILPWTRQGRHERWLAKNGQRYQYGSYAYSASELCVPSSGANRRDRLTWRAQAAARRPALDQSQRRRRLPEHRAHPLVQGRGRLRGPSQGPRHDRRFVRLAARGSRTSGHPLILEVLTLLVRSFRHSLKARDRSTSTTWPKSSASPP
jgi:hypothetical protein